MERFWFRIDDYRLIFFDDITDVEVVFHHEFEYVVSRHAVDTDDGRRVEHVSDRAADTHVAAIFTECGTDFRRRPVDVVRERVDDEHRAVRPEPFIAELVEVLFVAAFRFVDSAVDDGARDVIRLRPFDDELERLV